MKVSLPLAHAVRLALALSAGLATLSLRADDASAPTGETVKLPDLTVTGKQELPPPEAWQYARLPDGTEVLSNASERASVRMLRDFQMFQDALTVAWPSLGNHTPTLARTLILCGRRAKFDDFAPKDAGRPDLGSTSLFVRSREQAAIVVDLQATSLLLSGLNDDAIGTITSFDVDPNKQLYREYVRYLLSQGATRPPAWLQEGISQIVMAMEFTPDWIKLGEIDSSAYQRSAPVGDGAAPVDEEAEDEEAAAETSVGDRPFNIVLQRRALMPLDRFFAVAADAPEATNPHGNNRWAKQAYAFVHMCLYGENGRYKAAFEQLTKRLATEPMSEALFKECFKESYKDMLMTLRGYIGYTAHQSVIHKRRTGSPKLGGDPVVMREATQAEVGRIKGDAQRLAGRTHDALQSYHDAYARGEREPILLAAYGVAAGETGQSDRALPLLEAAAAAPGTRRPGAYIELARQRLAASRAKAANGRLDDTQVKTVMEPLLKARTIRPPQPETYVALTETWLAAANPPKNENLALLGEGIRLFSREPSLLYPLAQLYQQIGESVAATKVAQMGLHFSVIAEDRARFTQLLATLPPAPAK